MTTARIIERVALSFAPVNETTDMKTTTTMETMKRNSVQLLGNLGKDPEMKEVNGGRRVARMSVATNESWKDASGQWKQDVQWHPVVAWGKQAEQVAEQLRKGSRVSLEGRLVHRSYETKDGQKRYVTEIVLGTFQVVNTEVEEQAN
jgi:single-strand DNA-binding protein